MKGWILLFFFSNNYHHDIPNLVGTVPVCFVRAWHYPWESISIVPMTKSKE